MALKIKLNPKIKLVPLPKSAARAGMAGEFINALAPNQQNLVKRIQQCVLEGLIASVSITGIDGLNIARVRYTYTFDPLAEDTLLHLDLSNGRSHTEAVDSGFAAALAHAVKTMERRKLRPDTSFQWSPTASPTRTAEVSRQNGFYDKTLQPIADADGFVPAPDFPPAGLPPTPREASAWSFRTLLNLTAGKDPGVHLKIEEARRNR